MPTAPTITGITFDKTSYTPGQTITATITGTFSEVFTLTGTLSDGSQATSNFTIDDVLTVSDNGGRTWTLVSNNETTAVYTATA
jgi:hypothetical protein